MPTEFRPSRRLVVTAGAAALAAMGGAALGWPWAPLWRSGLPDPADPRTTMEAVERAVARLLPVPEITGAELAQLLAAGERVVLFDVREAEEYAQSHIPGALRVPPAASGASVLAEHGARMAGATVVLYCAVGWRSGLMVQGIREAAAQAPAAAVFNLRGGIFRWHAEAGRLEFAPGATGVHPFDIAWGQLLRRMTGG